MSKSKKVVLNLIFSLSYRLIVMVIGLIIPRLFILQYGSEVNGLQASIGQIFSYIALIEAGVGEASLQALYRPISQKDYRNANAVLSATTHYYNKIGVAYFIILILMGIIYPTVMPVKSMSYFNVFLYIIIAGATTGVNFFFVAKVALVIGVSGDNYWASVLQLFVYILTSASKIICILLGYNIVIIQLSFFAVNMLYTLVIYIFAKKRYPWLSFRETPDYQAINQKNSVLIHKISGIIFQNTDVLLLTFFCDLNTVSVYTVYKLVVGSVLSIISLANSSFSFALGQIFSIDRDRYCKVIDAYNIFFSTVAYGLFTVTYILYTPFIQLYTAGSDITYIDHWLPLLFILVEILGMGREAMMSTITVAGYFKKTMWRSLLESIINLVVSIVLVNIIGIYGVLLGTVVALLYRTTDINIYGNHEVLKRSCGKTMFIWISNMTILLCEKVFIDYIDVINVDSYLEFVIWGIVLTIITLMIFGVFNIMTHPSDSKYAFEFVKGFIFRRNKEK